MRCAFLKTTPELPDVQRLSVLMLQGDSVDGKSGSLKDLPMDTIKHNSIASPIVKALTAGSLRSVPRSQRGGHGEQVPTVALAVPLREREFSARRLWHTPTASPCAGHFKLYHRDK